MSFIVFIEAIGRLIEKLSELMSRREVEEKKEEKRELPQPRVIVYDCRVARVRVDPQKLAIVDPALYVDIPLIEPPRNLIPEIARREIEEGREVKPPTTIVLSSRELITPYVAEAIRQHMGIMVEPDIGKEEKEEEKKKGE